MKKNIMKKTVSALKTDKNGYCKITHKRGWLDFLDDGDLVFTPRELHRTLREIINMDENLPRGGKLFHLHRKGRFTLKDNKEPYRPEEALERLVVFSNGTNFFNQIPIGGGKESIDIGIAENRSLFTFIELKPWNSSNSPFYAVIESLKNLVEYRIIHENEIRPIPIYKDIALCVLAPMAYYEKYALVDDHGSTLKKRIPPCRSLLNAMAKEFSIKITLQALNMGREYFNKVCTDIYDRQNLKGQAIATIDSTDALPVLERKNWVSIISSKTQFQTNTTY